MTPEPLIQRELANNPGIRRDTAIRRIKARAILRDRMHRGRFAPPSQGPLPVQHGDAVGIDMQMVEG